MKLMQFCILLRDEVQPIGGQVEVVRRGRIYSRSRHSSLAFGKCKAGISLLHNAVSRKGEFSRGRIVASGNIWEVVDPDYCLRIDHRQIAPRSTGELTPKNHILLPSVNFTPLRWYVGMSATFLIALNRFKMRRAKNFNNLIFFLTFIIN